MSLLACLFSRPTKSHYARGNKMASAPAVARFRSAALPPSRPTAVSVTRHVAFHLLAAAAVATDPRIIYCIIARVVIVVQLIDERLLSSTHVIEIRRVYIPWSLFRMILSSRCIDNK
jgi:hypothetical protein